MKPVVSIILPARNEELLIKETINELVEYLKEKKLQYEIIVVINGSSDKTKKIVNALSKKNKQIVSLSSRPGYGPALRKGLEEGRGDYYVIYNVDFYDTYLLDLISADMYGKDLIIGSKLAHWAEDERSFSRRFVSRGFNFFLFLAFGFKGSDTHGIKLIRKSVVESIYPQCVTESGIFDTEFVIRAQRENFKIADFPVRVVEKRTSRFPNRIWQTPLDIWQLFVALRHGQSRHEKELFYNKISDTWESVINTTETNKRLHIVFDILLKNIPIHGKSFLEVGCGLGYFSQMASKKGAQVTGIDIGEQLVEKCRLKIKKGTFLAASANDLPFQDHSFDILLSTEVIEHVVYQEKAINEIIRVTKPGGYIVLTTPNRLFKPVFDLLSITGIRPYQGNEVWYYQKDLMAILKKYDVKILKFIGFNFIYPHPLLNFFEKFEILRGFMINTGFLLQKK